MVDKIIVYAAVLLVAVIAAFAAYITISQGGAPPASTTSVTTYGGNVNVSGSSSVPVTVTNTSTSVPTTTAAQITTVNQSLAASMGAWQATSVYPLLIYNQTCVEWNSYVYCFGGSTSQGSATKRVYFAHLTSGGIGTWKATASFPINASAPACSVDNGTVYCVGGMLRNGTTIPYAYFANLSASGISSWDFSVGYPVHIAGTSCTALNGFFYCVGGFNTTAPLAAVNYAQLDNGTYQFWFIGAGHPVNTSFTTCLGQDSIIYCFAGTGGESDYYGIINSSYGAISGWFPSGAYPVPAYAPSCAAWNGHAYCVGGYTSGYTALSETYYTQLLQAGIGSWTPGTTYPSPGLDEGSCVASNGYLYCIGGKNESGASYFARIT